MNDAPNPHPTLVAGMVLELRVARTTPIGAFLDAGTDSLQDDILLHRHQQTRQVAKGEVLSVYLYNDAQGRITASMRLPQLEEGQLGWVRVKTTGNLGAFVDVGTEKDVLLPHAEMAGTRPLRGESIFVAIYADKSGRLCATMKVDDWLQEDYKRPKGVAVGQRLWVRPYMVTPRGASVVTDDLMWGLIPAGQGQFLRRGQPVEAVVTRVVVGGRLHLSVAAAVEGRDSRSADAEAILKVLKERGGEMPYSDATPPEVLRDRFGLSKAAFKRALGKLIAEGIVQQEGAWTMLLPPPPGDP